VVEGDLRRDLRLDVLDELWANATMSEAKASELAVEAQHATRPPAGIWVRAVVDVNVLISGVLSAKGSRRDPARLSRRPV
jgi:hypothetical protein